MLGDRPLTISMMAVVCAVSLIAVLLPPVPLAAEEGVEESEGGGGDPYQSMSLVTDEIEATEAVALGDLALLADDDALLATDGTPEGTVDLTPEGAERFEFDPHAVDDDGGVAYVTTESTDTGVLRADGIWRTDGTPEGTERVVDVADVALGEPDPDGEVTRIERVVVADDGTVAFAAWTTGTDLNADDRVFLLDDDAPGGAAQALDERIRRGGVASVGDAFVVHANPDGPVQAVRRLGADGTALELWGGSGTSTHSEALARTGTHVFWWADAADTDDRALWATDGTLAGTVQVTVPPEDPEVDNTLLFPAEGRLYFVVDGERFWSSDGTVDGTDEVWDTDLLGDRMNWSINAFDIAPVGYRLLVNVPDNFRTDIDPDDEGWWAFDGETGEVGPLRVDGETLSDNLDQVAPGDGKSWVYSAGELWVTDGTDDGTLQAAPDEIEGLPGANEAAWAVGDTVVFRHRDAWNAPTHMHRIDLDGPQWPDGAELSAPDVGPTFATLEWDAALPDEDGDVTGYRVLLDGELAERVGADTTEALLDGLEPETTSTVAVEALGGFGAISPGPTTEVATSPDGDVDTVPLTATPQPGQVILDWAGATDSDLDSYTVYRAEGDGSFEQLADEVTESEYVDAGPDAETTYTYEVRKVVGGSEQPHTDRATVDVPSLSLDSIGWSAPLLEEAVAQLGGTLAVTVEGDPHRQAEATLTLAEAPDEVVALSEVDSGSGTYTGTFTLSEGVAGIDTVAAELCDNAGSCDDATESTDLTVGAAMEVGLDAPGDALDGGRLTVSHDGTAADVGTIDDDNEARAGRLLPDREYQARVTHPDGYEVGRADGITVGPGEVARPNLEVTLRPDLATRVEFEDGAPAVDTRVTVRDDQGETVGFRIVDDDGERLFRHVPEGDYVVRAVGDDDERHTLHAVEQHIDHAYGDDEPVVLVLTDLAEATIAGSVVDGDGELLSGVDITVTQDVDGRDWTHRARTDEDGTYTVDVLAGDADVEATQGRVSTDAAVAVADGVTETLDLTLDATEQYDFEILMYTQYAGQQVEGPLHLDWRTTVHLYPTVNGRRSRGNPQRHPGAPGETVEVCADGREADLSSDCAEVDFSGDGLGVAELVLRQPAAVDAELLDGDGELWADRWAVRVRRVTEDGLVTKAQPAYFGPEATVPLPGAGEYQLEFSAHGVSAPPVRVEVAEGDLVDVGRLYLVEPGPFAQGGAVSLSASEVRPGERVTVRGEYVLADDEGADDVVLVLDVPDGASMVSSGVTLDGEEVAIADLEQEGSSYLLTVGDLDPGDAGIVRYALSVDDEAEMGGTLGPSVGVRYTAGGEQRDEPLGAAVARVAGVSIDAPRTVAEHDVALSGRAPAGETVRIRDGATLVAETTATPGGIWHAQAELVKRGPRHRHVLHARVEEQGLVSDERTVVYDGDAPVPVRVVVDQGRGPREEFDPRDGVARFPFTRVPRTPVIIEAEFDDPDRVVDPVAAIGGNEQPMHREGDTFLASIDIVVAEIGPVRVDYETEAAPLAVDEVVDTLLTPGVVRNRLPAALDDMQVGEVSESAGAQGATFQGTGNGNGDLIDEGDHDETLTVEASSTRWDVEFESTLTLREIDDYQPTAADLAFEARTGTPAYATSFSWSITPAGFEGEVRATIPADELPEADDMESAVAEVMEAALASDLAHAGDAEATFARWDGEQPEVQLAQAPRRAFDTTYKVVSTGGTIDDVLGALSGGDVYDELGDLIDDMIEACGEGAPTDLFLDQLNGVAQDAAAAQVMQASLMATGGLVAAGTGGLGGVAIIGIAAVLDHQLDQSIDDRIENLRDDIMDDPDCDEDVILPPDDPPDPLARPVWIYDPAGYVFEAVESNRIEGATVTVLEGDPAEAPSPDDVASWAPWDAEWFGQTNPLVTGADGRYAWDVPNGWWHTRAVKDGYEPVRSEVLRVLPEHFDVHLGLVSLADPEVVDVVAWSSGAVSPAEVVVEFDHWMRASVTSERISVVDADSGEEVAGSVEPVDAQPHSLGRADGALAGEVAPEGEFLAERFSFVSEDDWDVGDGLVVTVDGLAQAYNLGVVGDDEDVELEVAGRPASGAISSAAWVVEETGTGTLRGLELEAAILDGTVEDLDGVTATLVDETGTLLAELEWSGAPLGETFVVPFDIEGWGSFDYPADGDWEVVAALSPQDTQQADRVLLETAFADGRTQMASLGTFTGDRSVVVPAFEVAEETPSPPPSPPFDDDTPTPGPDEDTDVGPVLDCSEVPPVVFPDVAGSSVHAPAVGCAAAAGLVEGRVDGSFGPGDPLSRGAAASIVVAALAEAGVELPPPAPVPDDVAGTTHEPAVGILYAAGVVRGYQDGSFGTYDEVSRAQWATMLAGAATHLDQEVDTTSGAPFPDVAGTHAGAIAWAVDAGAVAGFPDGTFRPHLQVTRAQAVSMLVGWLSVESSPTRSHAEAASSPPR